MELIISGLSRWFYLGILAALVGAVLIYRSRKQITGKTMENGYFILVLGLVGIVSEWADFATTLLLLTLLCVLVLVVYRLYCYGKTYCHNNTHNKINQIAITNQNSLAVKPHYVRYAREILPVLLVVWLLRAFLFEAYQIPSSSMRPDLTVGDFIVVNKFIYGIREPISNKVFIPVKPIKRGDVVVFKDVEVPNRDLIKRVVAIGGDKIEYYDKHLTINGRMLDYTDNGTYRYSDVYPNVGKVDFHNNRYIENLLGVKHSIITMDEMPTLIANEVHNFPYRSNCQYLGNSGFSCIVPAYHYFMMGDNRDNSEDSRYWGFVPDKNILGKAVYVWMNFHDFSRIGHKI